MTVLVLADDLDASADAVISRLADDDVPVCRINTGWFPANLRLDAELRGTGWSGRLRTPAHQVDLADIHSVWLRSPAAFTFPERWSSAERQHSHTEAKFGLGGVLTSLPALWVNHPSRVADAAYKPVQLAIAGQLGMNVPDSLITNDPEAVLRFADGAGNGTVLTKMLGTPMITEEGDVKVAFTRRVHHDDLRDLTGVEWTAHQFQRWVPKACDVRVIAIGDRHWAVRITSDSAEGHLDFRSDYDSLHHEPHDEPDDLHRVINMYLERFGLVYGAFDFVVDHDDRWWFLEFTDQSITCS